MYTNFFLIQLSFRSMQCIWLFIFDLLTRTTTATATATPVKNISLLYVKCVSASGKMFICVYRVWLIHMDENEPLNQAFWKSECITYTSTARQLIAAWVHTLSRCQLSCQLACMTDTTNK